MTGHNETLRDQRRHATITAATICDTLSLALPDFEATMLEFPQLLQQATAPSRTQRVRCRTSPLNEFAS